MSRYDHLDYPRILYHPKHAPYPVGREFKTADETKELGKGWVTNPQDIPPPSKIETWLQESFKPWWSQWEWLIRIIGGALATIATAIFAKLFV